MFIEKSTFPRRALLKGMGRRVPFLDAMVPAASVLAKTAAAPPPETAAGLHGDGARQRWQHASA